jgi:hypothetical protein
MGFEQMIEHQLVQQTYTQAAPVVALFGRELLHGAAVGEAGQHPPAVARRPQPQDVLSSVGVNQAPRFARRAGPLPDRFQREIFCQGARYVVLRERSQSADQPMRRQDHQSRVTHSYEHHHHEIRRTVGTGEFSGSLQSVSEIDGRFVAVMPIGNEDRLLAEDSTHPFNNAMIGHRPHPVDDAQMVCRFQRGNRRKCLFERLLYGIFLIGIQSENRREVELTGLQQLQTVGFRPRHRLFMGEHFPFAEALQPDLAQKPAAGVSLPFPVEDLVIGIERVFVLLNEHTLMNPAPQEVGGPPILLVGTRVARLVAIQLEPNYVAGMLLVEPFLKLAVDNVIGGAGDVRKVAHLGDVVPPAAKGVSLDHGSRSSSCRLCSC